MISEHPLAICAVAVAATIGLCTAVADQWVIPTMTASLTHSIELLQEEATKSNEEKADLKKERDDLKTEASFTEARINRLTSEIEQVAADKDKAIEGLRAELFESQQANAFTKGYPYPVGLDALKIGDPIERIRAAYPNILHESKTIKTGDTASQLFRRVSVSFGRSEIDGKVEGLSFQLGDSVTRKYASPPLPPLREGWLEDTLTTALGAPVIIGPEDDCLVWQTQNPDLTVFFRKGDNGYFVSEHLSPGGCYITDEQRKKPPTKPIAQKNK